MEYGDIVIIILKLTTIWDLSTTLQKYFTIHIDLAQEVSFLNKAAIKSTLSKIPKNSKVIINAQDTVYIAHDVLDLIKEFKKIRAKEENIKVKLTGFKKEYDKKHIKLVHWQHKSQA